MAPSRMEADSFFILSLPSSKARTPLALTTANSRARTAPARATNANVLSIIMSSLDYMISLLYILFLHLTII